MAGRRKYVDRQEEGKRRVGGTEGRRNERWRGGITSHSSTCSQICSYLPHSHNYCIHAHRCGGSTLLHPLTSHPHRTHTHTYTHTVKAKGSSEHASLKLEAACPSPLPQYFGSHPSFTHLLVWQPLYWHAIICSCYNQFSTEEHKVCPMSTGDNTAMERMPFSKQEKL